MADLRAILVRDHDILQGHGCLRPAIAASSCVQLAEAYVAAGDQPRKKVCATHGHYDIVYGTEHCWLEGVADGTCRVVDAIVCVIEDA